jgi:hypothetical protein
MPSFQITQDSLIQALILLRKTHPTLPAVAWEISAFPTVEALQGSSFGPDAVDVLLAYAAALGGDIVPKHTFNHGGVHMQSLLLTTVFADVRVEIRGAVPAPNLSHLSLVAA